MEAILSPTCGLIIYQEQVMEIANVIGGYSMGEGDLLRRALAKKRTDSLSEHRSRFVAGAIRKGHSEKNAIEIFDFLSNFAGYSFNKAHSISYAYLSYWTVYLKAHYPKEYMAALLSLEGGYYERKVYISEIKKMGISLFAPDVNSGSLGFFPEEGGIRIGINNIKGVGLQSAEALLLCLKEHGKFISFQDFFSKLRMYDIKKPILKALIKAGACDGLSADRKRMLKLAGGDLGEENSEDFSEREKRQLEKKLLGFNLRQFPPDKLKSFYERYRVIPISKL